PSYLNIAASPDDFGCYVVDVDGKEGEHSWISLELTYGKVPCGYVVATPSGGRHYWFKGSMHSSVRKVAPGIDIRGIGGYVLLPGSTIGGRDYKVISGSLATIAEAPAPLHENIHVSSVKTHAEREIRTAPVNQGWAQQKVREYIGRM